MPNSGRAPVVVTRPTSVEVPVCGCDSLEDAEGSARSV